MSLGSEVPEAVPPSGLLGKYAVVVSRLCRFAYGLAAALVLMDMVLIGGAVVFRYFFSAGFLGADEIVALSLTAIVMLAAPEVLRRNQHIIVDVVVALLPPRAKIWTQMWAAVSVMAVAALLIINGSNTVAFSHMIGSLTDGHLEWPVWMLQSFLPLGGVLLGLVALEQIWRAAAALCGGHASQTLKQGKPNPQSPADTL